MYVEGDEKSKKWTGCPAPRPPCNKVIFNASLSLKHVLIAHQPYRQGPFCQLKLQTGRHFIMESFL
jgi:hypothetical protein